VPLSGIVTWGVLLALLATGRVQVTTPAVLVPQYDLYRRPLWEQAERAAWGRA